MSNRLQIIVSESLDRRLRKAAQRSRLSMSAYVRQAIERALADERRSPTFDEEFDRISGITRIELT